MGKKINPNLSFVRPEHYNKMLELFVRHQEMKTEEKPPIVLLVCVIALAVPHLCCVFLSSNGFTYLWPVVHFL